MNTTKPWYASKGAWGGLLAGIAPVVAALTGYDFPMETTEQVAGSLAMIGGAIAGFVALVGRLRARSRITLNGIAVPVMAAGLVLGGCAGGVGETLEAGEDAAAVAAARALQTECARSERNRAEFYAKVVEAAEARNMTARPVPQDCDGDGAVDALPNSPY